MYSSSPTYQCPKSSPLAAAQARRRSQYKALTPNTPVPSRIPLNPRRTTTNSAVPNSPTVSLRDRFKARCFERAAKAREKAIKGKRHAIQPSSSDDFDMDYDDEEDDEDIMQDELFRRIMSNTTRKEHHSYRISYAQHVGSSFDPDLEDVDTWEQELTVSRSANLPGTPKQSLKEEELTPIDLDDEELETYAEECAQRAALADFDDIPEEELFGWSDFEEPDELIPHTEQSQFERYHMPVDIA